MANIYLNITKMWLLSKFSVSKRKELILIKVVDKVLFLPSMNFEIDAFPHK